MARAKPAAEIAPSFVRPSAKRGRKREQTRARIRAAAAEIVGRDGYLGASMAKITEAAGMSGGLFYYYYDSREQLLDELLPELGKEMVAYIVRKVDHLPFGAAREMTSFSAYLDYIRDNPQFFRIFTEAQVYVPAAYALHLRWILDNYVVALRRQMVDGGLDVAERDLEALAYMLIGIRNFATQMLYGSGLPIKASRAAMLRIYAKALNGIFSGQGRGEAEIAR